jgi:hypothetical protein
VAAVVPVVFFVVPSNHGPKCVANPMRMLLTCVVMYQSA